MPRGDRTGPSGMGPMSGRGAGYCTGYATPGFNNPTGGTGYGRGGGRGRRCGMGGGAGYGYRNRFFAGWSGVTPAPQYPQYGFAPPTKEQRITILKEQARYFDEQLTGIKKQLENLEGSDTIE